MAKHLWTGTSIPKFKKETNSNHLVELRRRVNCELKFSKRLDKKLVKTKVILFPIIYMMGLIFVFNAYPNMLLFFLGYSLLGFFTIFIFLTVIHELSHDNVFKSHRLNQLFLYFFDILGANSFVWKNRHKLMHHNYPNVNGWDTDIEQSKLFKVCPNAPSSKFHKHQHYLIFILYPLYLFNWLIIRDFKDFFNNKSTVRKVITIPKVEYAKLFFFKTLYLFNMFWVPVNLFEIPLWTAFAGFMVLTLTASVFALIVLLPPHANIENEFPKVSKELRLPDTWLEHQLKTTNDISNQNWFITFFMGNFNCHLAHHLFPNLDYSELKKATEVVKIYAKEKELPYRSYSMKQALINHYKLIKLNANGSSLFEETL